MTQRPSKDHQTVVKQQPDPETNLTKTNDIFLISGNDYMVKHIRPINKLGLQDILAL